MKKRLLATLLALCLIVGLLPTVALASSGSVDVYIIGRDELITYQKVDLDEAAKIDGAGKFTTFFKITIPLIAPVAQTILLLSINGTLQTGEYVILLTNGAPGGATYPDLPHEGEEFGYVLQGSVKIHVGNKVYKAKKGESFYFTPHAKHYIEASSSSGARLIWVSTPPSF